MAIPTSEELELLHSYMCKAVADPKRIHILYALHDAARNVTSLAEALDMPQPTVSRHLALLKQRGIVLSERDGASVIYRVADERIIGVLDTMRQMLGDLFNEHQHNLGTP